jgi:Transcriptional regulator
MRYVLPPMHTLRTFEALGRLRNFTRTAEELYLTASAVSHQIKAIESFYATKLFQRNRRDVMLTPAGERLLEVVRGMLQQLSSVGESLRVRDASRLGYGTAFIGKSLAHAAPGRVSEATSGN